ncbi:MAG: hypothetical protein WA843_02705 [Candidatus Saccharimonadales bacterium]
MEHFNEFVLGKARETVSRQPAEDVPIETARSPKAPSIMQERVGIAADQAATEEPGPPTANRLRALGSWLLNNFGLASINSKGANHL